MRQLLNRWGVACRDAGTTAEDAVDAAGRALLDRWAEPHRHYHNVEHLAAVLDVLADQGAGPLVVLAAWWHDAVYDPRLPGDGNERASAEVAVEVLTGLGVPAAAVTEVARLVLVTAGHTPTPDDRAGALLCDADLAVLAWPADRYDRYTAAVRREYAHVPDDAFRAGRATVLRQLSALPRLYRTPQLAARWEQPARANLRRELAGLIAAAPTDAGGAGAWGDAAPPP